jgi:DNA-directed RNA polymerase specialized sigma subunit
MAKPRKRPKKAITELEFNEAYKNRDNQSIINSVLKKYSNTLDYDTLKSCGLHALWRCLESHSDEFKTKFTSSLYKFTKWECDREILKYNKRKDTTFELFDVAVEGEEISIFEDIEEILSPEHASIVKMRFIEDHTLEEIGNHFGYTKEAARQKLKNALEILREVYKHIRIG